MADRQSGVRGFQKSFSGTQLLLMVVQRAVDSYEVF